MKSEVMFRLWKYFRDGYSIYVSFPLGVFSSLTVVYYLFVENFGELKGLFPHFYLFALIGLVTVVPLGILLGYWHNRRSKAFAMDSIIGTENNPIYVHNQVIGLKATIDIMNALGTAPSKEFLEWHKYWQALDNRLSQHRKNEGDC